MKIKVIKSFDLNKFSDDVNKHLQDGWELFGEPKIETIVTKNIWDGNERNSSVDTIYHQILKFKP